MDLRAKSSNDYRWDDLRIAMSSVKVAGVHDPNFAKLTGSGATDGVYTYFFDPATEEEVYFETQMPHDWYQGSSIYPHIHWCPTSTGSGNVVWGLEYTLASVSGTFGQTVLMSASFAATGTINYHQMAILPSMSMSGKTISCIIFGRLYRAAADGGDTYAEDAAAISFDFHYQKDDRGSYNQYTK